MKTFLQPGTLLFIFFCLFIVNPLISQENSGFLLMKGNDTLSVERYSTSGNTTSGRVLFQKKIPVTYQYTTNEGKQLEKLSVQVLKAGSANSIQQEGVLKFVGDSIQVYTKKGDTEKNETIPTEKGAMAYHPSLPMLSLLEQIVQRAQNLKNEKVNLPLYLLANNKTVSAEVNFAQPDSAIVSFGNIKVNLDINGKGEILGGKTKDGLEIKKVGSVPDSALSTEAPDYSAPEDAPYTAEEVKIRTKAGHTLAGTLTIPKDAEGPVPVVVTITGSSPQDRDHNTPFGGEYKLYRNLADTLGRLGIAVLRMDDRGVGGSGGNLETATTAERADDIREGISYLSGRSNLDYENVVLVGLSEGAIIAPMIANTNENLGGIVSMAGSASSGKEVIKYQVQNQVSTIDSLTSDEKEKLVQKNMEEIQKEAEEDEWLEYFLNYDPLKIVGKVSSVPVLILHGSKDQNVPPEDAELLAKTFKKAGNNDVTLKVFEDVNHIFIKDKDGNPENYKNLESFQIAPEVMSTIVDWIREKTSVK